MESTTMLGDFVYTVVCAFGFVIARFLLDRFIFTRLAIWLSSSGSVQSKTDDATKAKLVKCRESLWKLTYYATLETCLIKTIYNEPWVRNINECFLGWPDQEFELPLKVIYMCQCGFYLFSIGSLLVWETRRKDFYVMMSHHVLTVLMIAISYFSSLFRIGVIILAVHDGSDVFMEAAKVFNYSGMEIGASVCFGIFAVSWFILRLILLPFWVVKSTSYDVPDYMDLSKTPVFLLYYVLNTMIMTLIVFHIYWFKLICIMLWGQLRNSGKVEKDVRSDSEDDD